MLEAAATHGTLPHPQPARHCGRMKASRGPLPLPDVPDVMKAYLEQLKARGVRLCIATATAETFYTRLPHCRLEWATSLSSS